MLRDGALVSGAEGHLLRISLPWIRSLPLASVIDLSLAFDGVPEPDVHVVLGQRSLSVADLVHETGWWHLQDHLVLRGGRVLPHGAHSVGICLSLQIPYLSGAGGPLVLDLQEERTLVLDEASPPSTARDTGGGKDKT